MAKVPEEAIARLEAADLYVSTPFPPGHVWPDGVMVASGEAQRQHEAANPDAEIKVITGHIVRLFSRDGKIWEIDHVLHAGGYGPSDFANVWPSLDDAIEDVIDFFNGSAIRRLAKESSNPAVYRAAREAKDQATRLPDSAIKRLEHNRLVVEQNSPGREGVAYAVTIRPVDAAADAPVVRVYLEGGRWNVDARSNIATLDRELNFGEFWHIWPTVDQVIDDVIDFWCGPPVRRRALEWGRKLTAQEVAAGRW